MGAFSTRKTQTPHLGLKINNFTDGVKTPKAESKDGLEITRGAPLERKKTVIFI